MDEIIIKKMETDSEIRGKGYVHYKSWQETYRGMMDDGYLDRVTEEKCIEMAYRWQDNIIIAKDGDNVVGFVAYGPFREREIKGLGEIYALYVLKSHMGMGLGRRLLDAAIEKLAAFDRIIVEVVSQNSHARGFYEHYGFTFDGKERSLTFGTPTSIAEYQLHL